MSLAAVLLLASGCGSDGGSGLFGNPTGSGATTTVGSGAGTGGNGTGGSGATSGTGVAGGSMATGTGGDSSTGSGTGGTGGSCQMSPWYCDGDKDGFGDPNVMEMACTAPPGGDTKCPGPYVSTGDDCGPGDAMAYPKQMQFFGVKPAPPGPTPTFDYNCDGAEEKDTSQLYNGGMNMNCFMECIFTPNMPQGYGPNAVCGGTDEYYRCSTGFPACSLMKGTPPEPLRCR
jgi:hypothetical protein